MTCIGYSITAPDRALAWADSEIYGAASKPSGHAVKMAINPLAAVVGVGTGTMGLLFAGAEAVGRALSFDQLVDELPARLAAARDEYRDAAGLNLASRYAVVGFSHRFARMMGAAFDAPSYRARLCPRFAAPLAGIGHIGDEHSVIAAVQGQMAEIRRQNPRAGAGVVTVAELTPDGLRCRPLFDLARGTMLRRPVDLTETGEARRPTAARTDKSAGVRENSDGRRPL